VLLVYASCRVLLEDRLAGLIGGLLLVCSVLFMGDHVGRTGDYDALLCLLTLGFVLCVGVYVDGETPHPGFWIAAAAALLVLAILTKGVAGGLAVPGLLVYAIMRRRLFAVLADWRAWLSFAGAAVVVTGYFVLRERLDPGSFAAAWSNNITDRMTTAIEGHQRGPAYYAWVLIRGFEPGMLLLPTLLIMPRHPDPAPRRLCLLTGLAALSCLAVISLAQTKLFWYAALVVPLAAVAIGASTSTWLQGGSSWPKSIALRRAMVGLPILLALPASFWFLNVRRPPAASLYWSPDQVWYGPFMAQIRASHHLDGTIILDGGVPNDGDLRHYSPVARFFIEDAERHGEHMRLLPTMADLPTNASVLSCDPNMREWLAIQKSFAIIRSDAHCVFGRFSDSSAHPSETKR
jgi:4-amino-4-deoxy-L-arabinose transferase-like glycosyltransferase